MRTLIKLLILVAVSGATPAAAQSSYPLNPDISWDIRCYMMASRLKGDDVEPEVRERARQLYSFYIGRLTVREPSHSKLAARMVEIGKEMVGKSIDAMEINSCGAFAQGTLKHIGIELQRQKPPEGEGS